MLIAYNDSMETHILQRLKERYPSAQWSMEDVAAMEDQIRHGQVIYSATQSTSPDRNIICLNYGYPEPLLLVVCINTGHLITALPAQQRSRWSGRALLQLTTTQSTRVLIKQKGIIYGS